MNDQDLLDLLEILEELNNRDSLEGEVSFFLVHQMLSSFRTAVAQRLHEQRKP